MSEDLVFHILDILPRDEIVISENEDAIEVEYDSGNDADADGEDDFKRRHRSSKKHAAETRSELLIHLFGRTVSGINIRVDVDGFCPYFYIEAPNLPQSSLRLAVRQLGEYIQRYCQFARHVKLELEFREKFYAFTNHQNFPFVKLTVKSIRHFYGLRQLFLDKQNQPSIKTPIGTLWKGSPSVYESNLDPMLRFLHTQNIQPCGWVRIKDVLADDLIADGGGFQRNQTTKPDSFEADGVAEIRCKYTDVLPAAAPAAAAPFITVSWDIECFSSSGDFPLAKKTFKKVAKDLYGLAETGEQAVSLIEHAMVWGPNKDVQAADASQMAPIICKYDLPPDARAVYKTGMYRSQVYAAIEKNLRTANTDRDDAVEKLSATLNTLLGTRFPIRGDPIIQIGAVVAINGSVTERHMFVYPSCDPIDGVILHQAPTESKMLTKWFQWMEHLDPDILIGYNVFGFDEKYLWERAEELGIENDVSFQSFNRLSCHGGVMRCEESFLSSSALGDNFLYMWSVQGRLQIDLYHYVKRTMNLASYKLDDVAMGLMSGSLIGIADEPIGHTLELTLKGAVKDIRVGRALKLLDGSEEAITEKLEVLAVAPGGKITVTWTSDDADEFTSIKADAEKWVIVKDDVSPAEIFKFHCGTSADRAKVAKYCIQDCDLVLELYKKLETFMNAMAMANVCSVPVRYIFTRGQGIKIESLIAKECLELNKCIITMPSPSQRGASDTSYEGAIVLDPIPSFYSRSPIGVGDFASLYPSTIISENISHDTLVWTKDFTDDGYLIRHVWGSAEYDGLEDIDYTDIKFDLLVPDPEDKRKNPRKIKVGNRICRYAQDSAGTLPIILNKLLAARKAKRQEAARETDQLRIILLDTEQLAYKLTANSLYGQLGSGTFKMRLQDLAASTTAYGRLQIMFAKEVIEQFYGPNSGDARCNANIMYGDTDSLFIEFNPRNPETGERLKGREAREATIELTTEAGHLVSHSLKAPHDFEFDKVFDQMLMFSKKRYAGKMYESNPDDFVYKYMGIALKRRDSAPIVKKIYGNAMKIILDESDVAKATHYVQEQALELVSGSTSLGLLTITKSLRAEYANPDRIAHKVLADRMCVRDPGTAPAAGDRIGYVFIKQVAGQVASKKQGDRIETPAYVRANPGLELDAAYYIQHQISAPISQMFGLLLDMMPGYRHSMLPAHFDECDMPTQLKHRECVAERILFEPALQRSSTMEQKRVMKKMFNMGVEITTTPKRRSVVTTVNTIEAPKKVQKQSRMTSYMKNKELIDTMKRMSADDSSSTGSRSSNSPKSPKSKK